MVVVAVTVVVVTVAVVVVVVTVVVHAGRDPQPYCSVWNGWFWDHALPVLIRYLWQSDSMSKPVAPAKMFSISATASTCHWLMSWLNAWRGIFRDKQPATRETWQRPPRGKRGHFNVGVQLRSAQHMPRSHGGGGHAHASSRPTGLHARV